MSVPQQARELAHRLLNLLLKRVEAGGRAQDIEETDVDRHRVLIQLLPLRVYVYALGSRLADYEFESIVSSHRPPGTVFDAFEIEIEGVRCGFYLYSLASLFDREVLAGLWHELREEIGRPVINAALPPEHTRHHLRAELITIESDPDELASRLLEPSLPAKFLDQAFIGDERGIADFLVQLYLRMGKASIEKDELIRFVEKNKSHFDEEFSALMKTATEAAIDTDESTGAYFSYVTENIRLALSGDFDRMDMRSDRLFWLVYALAHFLESDKIDIAAARSRLARPDTVQRISQHQLIYMIHDVAETIDSPQEPTIVMMVLIGECALLGRHAAVLRLACEIAGECARPPYHDAIADLTARGVEWLQGEAEDVSELAAQLERLQGRATRIADDDF